jgi:phospholipid/cholesterol/gamma-HCH transport system ATP-binding protein
MLDVHKSFGPQQVLRGLTVQMPSQKITAIMGPSGTGKSVTLKLLMGLLKPDRGEIRINDEEITGLGERDLNRVRRKFGMLFQDAALFDDMNVFENVSFPLYEHTTLSDGEIASRVHEKLAEVGLENVDYKLPNELSGGMRKRAGLARALMLDPEFLLFDEPTTGLDPIITDQIAELIADTHARHKMTIVLISHDLALSYRVADYIGMLYRGQIIEFCRPNEFRRSEQTFVKEFLAAQRKHETAV